MAKRKKKKRSPHPQPPPASSGPGAPRDPSPGDESVGPRRSLITLAFVLLAVFISFSPVLTAGFTNWDDDVHLTKNVIIRVLDFENIRRIFTQIINGTYIPLSTLSYALEYPFAHLHPFLYHFDNLLLHMGVTALVFFFSRQIGLSRRAAALAALLFGVHPMHVESVAWVTERKDVLYSLFYMGSLVLYWEYLVRGKMRPYLLSLGCALLSILAKPMALSLPLILFLCDWLYGRKLDRKMLLDKVPFFLCIVPITLITYLLNARVPGKGVDRGALIWVWCFAFYLKKFFLPLNLAPIYQAPRPVSWANFSFLSSAIIFLAAVTALIRSFVRKNRWLVFALLYFFLSIFFLLRFDEFDRNIVADRFMYLPSVGICIWLGVAGDAFLKKLAARGEYLQRGGYGLLGALFLALACGTFSQAGVWQNPVKFWNYAISKITVKNGVRATLWALNNRGDIYYKEKDYNLALKDYNRVIALDPNYLPAQTNKGVILARRGETDKAMDIFNSVIRQHPDSSIPFYWRGKLYAKQKKYKAAMADLETAMRMEPYDMSAYNEMALVYIDQGQYERALRFFNAALSIAPNPKIERNRETLYRQMSRSSVDQSGGEGQGQGPVPQASGSEGEQMRQGARYLHEGKMDLALAQFTEILKNEPDFAPAYGQRGIVYAMKGDYAKALKDFKKAVAEKPDYAAAYNNMGNVYAVLKKFDRAIANYTKAIAIDPSYADAYVNRGKVYRVKGENGRAEEDFKKARALNPNALSR